MSGNKPASKGKSVEAKTENKPDRPKGEQKKAPSAPRKPAEPIVVDLNGPRPTRPNRIEFEAKVKQLGSEITVHNDRLKAIREQIAKINENSKGSKGELDTAKTMMASLIAERKILFDDRATITTERDAWRQKQETFRANERSVRGELKFKDIESCDKQIAELEHKQATTSMSLQEEKKVIKEIKALQDCKKAFSSLEDIRGEVEKLHLAKDDIEKRLTHKNGQIDEVTKRINQQRGVLDLLNGANSSHRENIPALNAEYDESKGNINDKRKEIQRLEQEFRKLEDEYFAFVKEERKRIEEEKKAEIERKKAEKEAAEKERIEAELRKVPFEDEIKLCEELADYLDKKVKGHETLMKFHQRTAVTPSAPSSSNSGAASVTSDGKVLKLLSRNEGEEVLVYGKKDKKKEKVHVVKHSAMALSAGSSNANVEHPISYDDEVLTKFKFLSLPSGIPMSFSGDGVSTCLSEISSKKSFYQAQERGAQGVPTFNAFRNQSSSSSAPAEKNEATKESSEHKGKKAPESVFSVDQLRSTDLFPSLSSTVV